ncbi:hypothetical protein [Fluviispira multicolorata]|uniref:Uncharacterized protein n=1 Tax=Fluviispira multicolorata TaxID=2654512 RepID=A0A833N4V2_9BACT|nr:hypothetical protein [Fluviispira multicolorata]KAB8031823.1 hypothetical protein GCL57_04050 [Fluviispira multicolorata]
MTQISRLLPVVSVLSLFLISCSKNEKYFSENIQSANEITKARSSVLNSDGSSAKLLQGFNKMGFLFSESCLEGGESVLPKGIEKSIVDFSDNLKESDFRKVLNIGISATVPVKGVDISPEIKYAREASATKLSRTTTYSVYVRYGEHKITPKEGNIYKLKAGLEDNFNNSGKLENAYNFIKKCGDEIITSQRLSAKILLTMKLNFDSQKVLNDFQSKIGVSVKDVLTKQERIGINQNLKLLNEDTKKQIYLNVYGFQLGGDPTKLASVLTTKVSCRLDKIEECQPFFDRLNQYASDDFVKQLSVKDVNTWAIESSSTVEYDELNIANHNGVKLDFALTHDINTMEQLSRLKSDVSHAISKQIDNYTLANSLMNVKYLAEDEKNGIDNILTLSHTNIEMLQAFSSQCYVNLVDCLNNSSAKLTSLVSQYDETLLEPNIGELIAKIRSNNAPLSGQKERSSEDFIDFSKVIEKGKYSSFYFKVKNIDNNLIRNANARFDLKCNKPWYKGYDPVLFASIHPNYEVLTDTVTMNYNFNCAGQEAVYVANPKDIVEKDFIVEIWGRE